MVRGLRGFLRWKSVFRTVKFLFSTGQGLVRSIVLFRDELCIRLCARIFKNPLKTGFNDLLGGGWEWVSAGCGMVGANGASGS